MNSFRGVDRRFDFKIKNDQVVFLSDYAHHPSEIKQSVLSIRELYKDKKITAIFQPHLYTRTRDFYQDFADSLSLLDEVILVDIYPARETPIPGVTSKLIYDNLRPGIEKSMCKKEEILNILKDKNIEVLITLGAGDIDNYVPEIKKEAGKNEERRAKNEELRISTLHHTVAQPILNSSFSIFNSQLNKNYGKENPSIYRHVDAYRLPRHSHHRFQPQACRPDLP